MRAATPRGSTASWSRPSRPGIMPVRTLSPRWDRRPLRLARHRADRAACRGRLRDGRQIEEIAAIERHAVFPLADRHLEFRSRDHADRLLKAAGHNSFSIIAGSVLPGVFRARIRVEFDFAERNDYALRRLIPRIHQRRSFYSDQKKRAPSLSSGMGPGLSARISLVC